MIIKVCGMREADNIRQLSGLRIDWMGFVFWQPSPRSIPLGDNDCREAIRYCPLPTVGVFVDASADEMTQAADEYQLHFVQLHGSESPDVCRTLHKRGLPVIKAFAVADGNDLQQTLSYEGVADYFLFDAKCAGCYGGSGKRFDWEVLQAYGGQTPFLLSGGISPNSLSDLRCFRHPLWRGIDLNSGFEAKPGVKDHNLLAPFIDSVKTL